MRQPSKPRGARPSTAPAGRFASDRDSEAPVTARPEWVGAFTSGHTFGDPPPPKLRFLQHSPLAWQQPKDQRKKIWVTDVGKYRTFESVKITNGISETNIRGQPPRPRSALILAKEFADLRQPPRATSRNTPEAIYLLHCDSTETTLNRGSDFWMPERALASKPLGASRDWCSDGRPGWSKKFGGREGTLFEDIANEPLKAAKRAELHAQAAERRANAPPRPAPAKPPKAWIDPELRALKDVPPLRRRRFCPPQHRVRTSPRLVVAA